MSESNLWSRLRMAIGKVMDLQRVENMLEDGTPDVNYCIAGREGWIELKHTAAIPARAGTAVFGKSGLRMGQIEWIRRRWANSGSVWILAQVGEHLFLISGLYAEKFNSFTMQEFRDCAEWSHRGRSPDWQSFMNVL